MIGTRKRDILGSILILTGVFSLLYNMGYTIFGNSAEKFGAINSCIKEKPNTPPCTEERMNIAIKAQANQAFALQAGYAGMGLMAAGILASWPTGGPGTPTVTPVPKSYTRPNSLRKMKR